MLGPILFNIFIDDLEMGVHSEVSKFADNTKLFWLVKAQAEREELQKELTKLSEWTHKK